DVVVRVAQVVDGDALVPRDVRDVRGAPGDEHDVLVQHVVERDVGPQRQRGGLFVRVGEDGGTGYPHQVGLADLADEVEQRSFPFGPPGGDQLPAALPGEHDGE